MWCARSPSVIRFSELFAGRRSFRKIRVEGKVIAKDDRNGKVGEKRREEIKKEDEIERGIEMECKFRIK